MNAAFRGIAVAFAGLLLLSACAETQLAANLAKEVTPQQRQLIEAIIEHYEFKRDAPNYPPRPEQKV